MCGFVSIHASNNQSLDQYLVPSQTMLNTIIHRGPDSKGLYLGERFNLGFRRLSILDISKKATKVSEAKSDETEAPQET